MRNPEISIVSPVYNEQENLNKFYNELKDTLEKIPREYEIIFVDDGSEDNSFKILKKMQGKDNRTKIIKFTKNQGQSAAINCGFNYCSGDYIITMDSDLQFRSKDISKFLNKLDKGYEVVCGWRKNRFEVDGIRKAGPSKIFNFLVKVLFGDNLNDIAGGMRGIKKEVIECISLSNGMHRYLPIIASNYGFEVTEVPIQIRQRYQGESKYGVKRLLKGFFDLVFLVLFDKTF